MFYSRASNIKIILLHERTLRMIYNDQTSLFERLIKFYLKKITPLLFILLIFNHFSLKSPKLAHATIFDDLFTKSYNGCYILPSKSNFVLLGVRAKFEFAKLRALRAFAP